MYEAIPKIKYTSPANLWCENTVNQISTLALQVSGMGGPWESTTLIGSRCMHSDVLAKEY